MNKAPSAALHSSCHGCQALRNEWNGGCVVGWDLDGDIAAPFTWTVSRGLRRLTGLDDPHYDGAEPTDINNGGQVVGRRLGRKSSFFRSSFFWDETNQFFDLSDLSDLLDPADPMTAEVVLHAYNGRENQEFILKINDRARSFWRVR
jgi:hypothetical protein